MDLNVFGVGNNKGYRYVLVVNNKFSKIGWTVSIRNKKAIPKKVSFENILITSEEKPSLIETDDGEEIRNEVFTNFLNKTSLEDSLEIHL